MINLKLLREKPKEITELILRKEPKFKIEKLVELDSKLKTLKLEIQDLRQEKNKLAQQASSGGVTSELREKSIQIGRVLKSKEKEFLEIEPIFDKLLLSCPNVPQQDVPLGNKESNCVIKTFGKKKEFGFVPRNHVELGESLGWLDFDAATKMSGSNFALYKNQAVKLMYVLTHLMIKNNVKYGFNPILPPYLVTENSLVNSGNLPKFEGDFYKTQDGLCLIPTAEVSLTNLYVNQILTKEKLPVRHTAWTSCFRREAGGYGSTDRGLIRIHQFEKVENYSICEPEKSNNELQLMIDCAQDLLKQFGLHYRVSLLAAQDCSFSSAKTYDIEVWLPGQKEYYELSSCSNCTDFQSRRAKIRYRKLTDSKPELVHTLNASSLALPRLMVALMETYQKEDGTIEFPTVIKDLMDQIW
ncbi:serine--tRNA ligase [Candidatus Dependentiae bacterium]